MKKFLAIVALLTLFVVGCSHPKIEVMPVQVAQADGDYVQSTLPCKCGDICLYVPNSCPCFDREHYPDLAPAIENVYAWAQTHNKGVGKKVVGKYEVMTLECGCSLKLFIPESSGCLSIQSPDLESLLTVLYNTAKKHELAR